MFNRLVGGVDSSRTPPTGQVTSGNPACRLQTRRILPDTSKCFHGDGRSPPVPGAKVLALRSVLQRLRVVGHDLMSTRCCVLGVAGAPVKDLGFDPSVAVETGRRPRDQSGFVPSRQQTSVCKRRLSF